MVMQRIDLSNVPGIQNELSLLSKTPYPKISMTSRSLTINGKNYIYETGHSTTIRNDHEWTTLSTESIDCSSMQLNVTQRIRGGFNKFYLVLKDNPGSRKCPVLGQKS